jgi:hypothetical protein
MSVEGSWFSIQVFADDRRVLLLKFLTTNHLEDYVYFG